METGLDVVRTVEGILGVVAGVDRDDYNSLATIRRRHHLVAVTTITHF